MTGRTLKMLLPAWIAVLAAVACGAEPQAGKRTVKVAMSDGVALATDVHLPRGKGPFPAILIRTPYNKNRAGGRGFTRAGVAMVVQDMRGRFASEGRNLPFIGCGWVGHRDGAETVAWIRRQSWSNGKVGTLGGSAGGITQNLTAAAAPEGLSCQYISVAAASLYHHAAYVGGALRRSQITGWLRSNRFDPEAIELYRAHPTYDEFWHKFDSTWKHGVMTAPAVHVGGWFDTFSLGTIESFVGRQHKGAPGAKGTQKLVMGPWAHGGFRRGGLVGQLRFANSRMPGQYRPANWFSIHLKSDGKGAEDIPAVAYYVMGDVSDPKAPGNCWRTAADWPPPARPTPLYLLSDGKLTLDKPPVADGKPARAEYTFDPARPCPTVGGCNLLLPKGPMDQRKVEARRDVLTFTTDPLDAPREVTGRVAARLFVSSSAVDTDLSVRFCDVYPDGRSFLMAEGMLRLRYRDGLSKPVLLAPGKVYEVTVTCWPTSVVINKGHRIRVGVTSSNYPRFDVNPGTGAPPAPGAPTVKQTNRIYCDGVYPSRVVLPVVGTP